MCMWVCFHGNMKSPGLIAAVSCLPHSQSFWDKTVSFCRSAVTHYVRKVRGFQVRHYSAVIDDMLNFMTALWHVSTPNNIKHQTFTAKQYLIVLISTEWYTKVILNITKHDNFLLIFVLWSLLNQLLSCH